MRRSWLGPSAARIEDLPPEWRADFERLSNRIFDLTQRYAGSIVICFYDPRSLAGFVKAVRYRAHRYPSFVVAGQTRITGWDLVALEEALAERVQRLSANYG